MTNRWQWRVAVVAIVAAAAAGDAVTPAPPDAKTVAEEKDGYVAVEAEAFVAQHKDDVRRWYITRPGEKPPAAGADGDPSHADSASGKAYLEILPDTRRTHDDKLTRSENFADKGGIMAIVDYPVKFNTPGRYYVWVRAYSTGSEDNGIHVGLNGAWPESGQRLQWCEGKNTWRWESKQRTPQNHCGEPHKIFLDIDKPGVHVISFSMREDGFEFDQFLLTTSRDFARPEGPAPRRRRRSPDREGHQRVQGPRRRAAG